MLGGGGMGSVYLAQHPRLPRQDALKLLSGAHATNKEFRARFEREADITSSLRHPNIVSVYDRGAEGDQLWISMQYVEGTDVAELVRQGPSVLTIPRVITIISDAAKALDYAHRQGLLHRDVKPANILVTASVDEQSGETALLTDFGIARAVSSATEGLTQAGFMIGTTAYAAPEMLSGRTLDARVDVYALGCALYEMLTGSVPYKRESIAATMHAHLSAPPPVPSQVRQGLPPAIDAVVAKAMAKDPNQRYQTCRELAQDAARALGQAAPNLSTGPTFPVAPPPQAHSSGPTPYPSGPQSQFGSGPQSQFGSGPQSQFGSGPQSQYSSGQHPQGPPRPTPPPAYLSGPGIPAQGGPTQGGPPRGVPPQQPYGPPPSENKPSSTKWLIGGGVAAALIAVVVIVALVATSGGDSTDPTNASGGTSTAESSSEETTETTTEPTSTAAVPEGDIAEASDSSFSVVLPEGWRSARPDDGFIMKLFSPREEANILVSTNPPDLMGATVEESAEIVLGQVEEEFGGDLVVDAGGVEATTVAGEHAVRFTYSFVGETKARGRQLYVRHDGIEYIMTFTGTVDTFNGYVADYENIQNSWTWTD